MLRMPAAKVYLAPGATDMCAGIVIKVPIGGAIRVPIHTA